MSTVQLPTFQYCVFFSLDEDASNVQIMCAWCQKVGVKRYSLSMGSEMKSFCSEKCFAACRRAYFKRNKVKPFTLRPLDILLWHILETLQVD